MKALRTLRNYLFYCGIEKDAYNAVKKDAYVSNYKVWRVLQVFMVVCFAALYVSSFFSDMVAVNRPFYGNMLLYAVVSTCFLFLLKKDSLLAQFLIYLSIAALFLFACYISQNKPQLLATTFIVFLLITPMFMIDKPYFMALVLCIASAVFVTWMHRVKPYEVWRYDLANAITFTIVGIFLHIIANSLRIREFVLTREINIQKDTDELTGLKNKDALTRAINAYLEEYFSRFTEASFGDLIASLKETKKGVDDDGRETLELRYEVALAPFDLGVTQELRFIVSYDKEIQAYRLAMINTRLSGQDSNWTATNMPFLERMRTYLMHWRNLSPAEHSDYVRRGKELFSRQ